MVIRTNQCSIGSYYQGNSQAQGCVVGLNGDVWVAHSYSNNTVGHLTNDGRYVGTITVTSGSGNGPTGLAVDKNGYIWVTCYNGYVVRIDPNGGDFGPDGITRIGKVDLVTDNLGGQLYNYSDMTGSTLLGKPDTGIYEFIYDSKIDDVFWNKVEWDPNYEGDDANAVEVWISTSNTGEDNSFSDLVQVQNNSEFSVASGRYAKVTVRLNRLSDGSEPFVNSLNVSSIYYEDVLR